MGRVGHMAHPIFWLAACHTAFDGTNNCPVCSLILRTIGKTWCHQMSDLRAKIHQILFRWGSAQIQLGELSAPPGLAVFKGPTSKGRDKKEREEKGRGTVADPAIWADRVAAPLIDQNLGPWSRLREAVCLKRGGKF